MSSGYPCPRPSAIEGDLTFGFIDREANAQHLYNPRLINNRAGTEMLRTIKDELRHASSFTFSVAFITSQAIATLKQALLDFEGHGTIITSDYLDFNEPAMFEELLLLDNIDVRVLDSSQVGFHAKGYLFEHAVGMTAIIGSSNMTAKALRENEEWNLRFSAENNGDIVHQIKAGIDRQLELSTPLTSEWIEDYRTRRQVRTVVIPGDDHIPASTPPGAVIQPNLMQSEALEELRALRDAGEQRGLIISATGTGKTILAALAVREASPKRLLFLVHREQIVNKAMEEFQKVLTDASSADFGKYVGATKQIDRRYVFATVQSLSKTDALDRIHADHFDYIIIDEVHRAAAETYTRVIDHFSPTFLLGLTATPERTDGGDIYQLFDYNVPYEIRLNKALDSQMLVPFHYFGVTDYEKDGETITESSNLAQLVAQERVDHIVEKLTTYGHATGAKGLIFCSRATEAKELSDLLNTRTVNGHRLRTEALTGSDSADHRERTVRALENGDLDYILTIDIFNEGVDIPRLNQIVMLRATQSSIVFTQQLGRGLRKADGKDHLRVIDFIGNYNNNFLIPIALNGGDRGDKEEIKPIIRGEAAPGKELSGVSTINFDAISEARVLESLRKAKLDNLARLKKEIRELEIRNGFVPKLLDFATEGTFDPVLMAAGKKNYWSLLNHTKFLDTAPTETEALYLNFLSRELLNGKRPHELLIINELIKRGSMTLGDVRKMLVSEGTTAIMDVIWSAQRVLSLEFYTATERKNYSNIQIASLDGETLVIDPEFRHLYDSSSKVDAGRGEMSFKAAVDDIIATGLYLARHQHSWSGDFIVGRRYSRKDYCWLNNWATNQYSTIYGYKVNRSTGTCPIFVTYHKDDEISDSTKYGDKFIDNRTFHWFTRSKRTMESDEVEAIVKKETELHLFVKKDDKEAKDFYYLGSVTPTDAYQDKMPTDNGAFLDVVRMNLNLESPIEASLYEYLTTDTARIAMEGATADN